MDLSRVAAHDPTVVSGEAPVGESGARSGREAAILAPVLTRSGDDHIVFTKRAEDLSDHPGQMSFPGGGREPEDSDLLATALREADEEIGLPPSDVEVVGRLDDIRTVTGYQVRPFVGRVPDREYVPSDREVAEVAVLPVAALTDTDNYRAERRDHPRYEDVHLHFFTVRGYTVWGATANMLVQLLELATDWELPPEPDRVTDYDADLPS